MKSGYYLATVINAYRRAMDGANFAVSERELLAVAHREYTQAYMMGENKETVNYEDSQSRGDYIYIADVLGMKNGFVKAEMRNRFKQGDLLEVLSPDGNFSRTFIADEIYDSQDVRTDDAKRVQEIYTIKCPFELQAGDYLRRKA